MYINTLISSLDRRIKSLRPFLSTPLFSLLLFICRAQLTAAEGNRRLRTETDSYSKFYRDNRYYDELTGGTEYYSFYLSFAADLKT